MTRPHSSSTPGTVDPGGPSRSVEADGPEEAGGGADGSAGVLAGRTAIVTGSGRGIGAAVAEDLASLGARVVLNYRGDAESAEQVRRGIQEAGGEAIAVQADVSTEEGAASLVEAARSAFGRIDVLVSNAGPLFRPVPLREISWEEFGGTVEADLRCAFFSTQAVLPDMLEAGWGRLVLIGSASAERPSPGVAHHGAARAALTTYARYLAVELGGTGVTANVVAPGMVRTDRTANAGDAADRVAAFTPAGRIATPLDVARAVRFVAADEEGFQTGAVLKVDGGLTA
jgi:3-oxoacyl-[acyl-carrier protein] reductase